MTDEQLIRVVNLLTPAIVSSVKAAFEHSKPSPVTEKFMEESKKERTEILKDFSAQKFEIKELRNDTRDMKVLLTAMSLKMDTLDEKFASKWVERAIWSFIGLVMTAIGGTWMISILK